MTYVGTREWIDSPSIFQRDLLNLPKSVVKCLNLIVREF